MATKILGEAIKSADLVTPRCDTEEACSGARRRDRLCFPRTQRENLLTKTLDTNMETVYQVVYNSKGKLVLKDHFVIMLLILRVAGLNKGLN